MKDNEWSAPLVGHRRGYVEAIIAAGGLPVILPPTGDERVLRALFERIDGLLLAGGEDIAPTLYHEDAHPQLGTVVPERDDAELPLARWAVAEGKPVLGVCRGIQVLNVALGGTLWQDIPAQRPDSLDHEVSARLHRWDQFDHSIALEADSQLAALLGVTGLEVNSLHHQALEGRGAGAARGRPRARRAGRGRRGDWARLCRGRAVPPRGAVAAR